MIEKIPLQIGCSTSSQQADSRDNFHELTVINTEQDQLRAEIRDSLEVTDKGVVKNTIGNYVTVFTQDPLLKDSIRFNLLTERIDIIGDLGWHRSSSVLTDTDLNFLQYFCEKKYGLSSDKKMRSALSIVANNNCFHPIRQKLESLVWDGVPRIRHCLHHFLGSAEDDYTEEVFRHALLGAIRRVFIPGCKYEEVLALVGGQGIGKSTFLRFLAMNDEWFSDDIRRLDDEKVFQRLQGHWIVEICEMLATNNAKSVEESRSFFSRQKDTYRVPYESQPQDRLRQCIFAGTSNSYDFLPLDRAGNRRFLPVMTDGTKAEVHILDNEAESRAYIEQVWAEAMSIYNDGHYSMKFSPEIAKKLIEVQKDFMPEDYDAGKILDWLQSYKGNIVCCRMLHKEALGRMDEPKKYQLHAYVEIMRSDAGDKWRRFENPRSFGPEYGRQKGWERIKTAHDPPAREANPGNQLPDNQPKPNSIPNEQAVQLGMPAEWLEAG